MSKINMKAITIIATLVLAVVLGLALRNNLHDEGQGTVTEVNGNGTITKLEEQEEPKDNKKSISANQSIVLKDIKISMVTDPDEIEEAESFCDDEIKSETGLLRIPVKVTIQARNELPFVICDPYFYLEYHVFSENVEYLYGEEEDGVISWMEAYADRRTVGPNQDFTATIYHIFENPHYVFEYISAPEFYYLRSSGDVDLLRIEQDDSLRFKFSEYKEVYSALVEANGEYY